MKQKLTIGEFAKLKNVTTETLRHYDRIGLLKPIEIDPKTGYRYYSIFQEEELGTIKDLRQLGMSIDEIKKYFNNRNLKQSINILKDKHDDLKKRIQELQQLEESISEKIKHLDNISGVLDFEDIIIKEIDEREIVTFDKPIKDRIGLSYAFVELENVLEGIAPILAGNRIGTIISQEEIELNKYSESAILFYFAKNKESINVSHVKKIHKGTYACMYYKGSILNLEVNLKKMIDHIEKKGYRLCGDVLQIVQIDITVTDKSEEVLNEIQIPIKKC
ncbi:MerR family transcriptional regulator [Clostridium sediminicola]|uniref:MerR family transcriptional regulator n=1 Tax=Clostridium sediminicola TaxID=3114879 RepID=UPI0031F1F080